MTQEIRSAIIRVLPFAIILLVLFVQVKRKKLPPQDLFLQKPISTKLFLCWTIGFLALVLFIEYMLYKAGLLEIDKWNHPLLSSCIRILGAVVLAPIAEELIFRGIILNMLVKKKINLHLAIFMQAIFFVLLHNFAYQNTFSSNFGIAQGLLDASIFAYAKYSTQSIYTPITMHITGNVVATLERFII